MSINDKDFDVIEEAVDDFEYFYDVEEEFKRNRKIIFKYKMMSILIVCFVSIILITVIGVVRMGMYKTKNVLTQNEIARIEYKNTSEEIKEFAISFREEAWGQIQDTMSRYDNYDIMSEKLGLENYVINFEAYQEKLRAIKLPKDTDECSYSNYNEALLTFIGFEASILTSLQDENKYANCYSEAKAGDYSWSTSWDGELTDQFALLSLVYPF